MKFKIDLHIHSKFSADTTAEPEEIILRAIKLGLHGVAFTEHYSYAASEPVESLAEKYRGRILVLRGVEFSALEGHCLVFGTNTDRLLRNTAPLSSLVEAVNKAGGVVIPSHPFRPGTGIGDRVMEACGIAALEGCNGVNIQDMNRQAIAVAKIWGLPYTGGSDAHEAQDVGCCYTEFDERVTRENFVELLKAGKYRGVDTRTKPNLVMNDF